MTGKALSVVTMRLRREDNCKQQTMYVSQYTIYDYVHESVTANNLALGILFGTRMRDAELHMTNNLHVTY